MIAVAALAFWDLSDVVVASDCFRHIGTVAGDEVEGGAAAAEAHSWQEDFAVVSKTLACALPQEAESSSTVFLLLVRALPLILGSVTYGIIFNGPDCFKGPPTLAYKGRGSDLGA